MSDDRSRFVEAVWPVLRRSERALHDGDAEPRKAEWSRHDPLTLLGAGVRWRSGWAEVGPLQDHVATRFAGCLEDDLALLAADVSGDLGYLVAIERYRALRPSGEQVANELRVTHVYRREDGDWKLVHRHGDHLAATEPVYDTRGSSASASIP
jgi:ketosteroid isomerase-like protein